MLADAQDVEPGRSGKPNGRDPVIGSRREIHHGMFRPAVALPGGHVRAEGGGKGVRRPDADGVRPERPELADEPGGPDEIVGEDEHAQDARPALFARHDH